MLISKEQTECNQPTNQDLRHKRNVIFTRKIKKVVTYTKDASNSGNEQGFVRAL